MADAPPPPEGFVLDTPSVPPPPSGFTLDAPHTTIGSAAKNFGAGALEGLTGMAAMFSDPGAREEMGALNLHPDVMPEGPETAQHRLNQGFGPANPENIPANTALERIARGAGSGAVSTLLPGSIPAKLATAGREFLVNAAVGAGGAATQEVAPDALKPIAGLIGGVATGAATSPRAIAATAERVAAPFTQAGREGIAGKRLAAAATDPEAARQALESPQEIVPGSKPTTGQATGDLGLLALERAEQTRNPVPFQQRRAEQNTARRTQLDEVQQNGNPADLADYVKSHIQWLDRQTDADLADATKVAQTRARELGGDDTPEAYGAILREPLQRQAAQMDQQTERGVADATKIAQERTQALGGDKTPEEHGAALREPLQAARDVAKMRERALWKAVDPDGNLTVNAGPVRLEAKTVLAGIAKSAKPPTGDELHVLQSAAEYPQTIPFSELSALRTSVNDAMRQELRTAGQSQVYGRLSRMRSAIEQSINAAVERRAVEAPEELANGVAKLQQEATLWSRNSRASRESAVATDAIGEGAVSPVSRTEGTGGSGPGNAPANPDVSSTPTFDAEAAERLRLATQATRERADTFDRGPVGQSLAKSGRQDQYRISDASVPAKVFQPGPKGAEAIDAYRKAVGDNQALANLHDYAAFSLKRAASNADGTLDPAKVDKWLTRYGDTMRSFPELQARFRDARSASESLAEAVENRRNILGATQSGLLDKNLSAAAVPAKIFQPGPKGAEAVEAYRKAVGDGPAMQTLQDYAASSLRKAAERPDGTLDSAKTAAWMKQHDEALSASPDLQDKFKNTTAASDAIAEAAATRRTVLDTAQSGAFGKLVKLDQPEDIAKTIGGIFGAKDAVTQMRNLAKMARRNPEALEGLRKAISDHIQNRFIGNTEVAASGETQIKSDAFQSFVKDNRAALAEALSPEQVKSLQAIAADLQRGNRSLTAVKIPGQSNTAQDLIAQEGGSMLRRLIEHSGPIAWLGSKAVGALHAAGIDRSSDMVREALLNPELAKILLAKVRKNPTPGYDISLATRLRRSLAATMVSGNAGAGARTDDNQPALQVQEQRPPLSKGVMSNGMIPGHEGNLDPSKAGDNWATNQFSAGGGPEMHYVLPALPGDKPANDDTGFMGTAVERFLKDGKYYGAFDSDETGAEFMQERRPKEAYAHGGLVDKLDRQASVAGMPTEAQAKAGNYRKGRMSLHGLKIAIETPRNTVRRGTSADGTKWENANHLAHYGYVNGTTASDKENADVYVGPKPTSQRVFVVDQHDPKTGKFDETKSVLGTHSAQEAAKIYDAGFSDGSGPSRRKNVTEMHVGKFKEWLAKGGAKKPAAETRTG